MIKNAEMGKELVLTVPNKMGTMTTVSKVLADHGINVEGIAGYATGNEARIMIVADDVLRAGEALEKAGFKAVEAKEVVVVELENKPGALKSLSARISDAKIDIKYIYGSTCSGGCASTVIVSTYDNEKALVIFKG
ncbi:MAG: ACT domain-containing protein [Candidatus Omnitrophica bacterium]|nr:ACT domain-containing protein [Candidatus Omnitrophota bacterium]